MAQTVRAATEQVRAGALVAVESYGNTIASVLPSHIKPQTFLRLAQGALRRNPALEEAANANFESFLHAVLDAARLGLEPGTEQYYLVPYKDRGKLTVQGLPGYQGEVELMYRSGAVASVVVELVRENDVFVWQRGQLDTEQPPRWEGPQKTPYHKVDWFGGDRGELKGVYAYAEMVGGAISEVVVLDKDQVHEARSRSASFKYRPDTSPWTTDEAAMWLKTAAHRLRKWVPTSPEYRREQMRAIAEADAIRQRPTVVRLPQHQAQASEPPVDAEVVGDDQQETGEQEKPAPSWPTAVQPGSGVEGGDRSE
ncbi:recombinase RecT [Streptomyces sp. G1]|uniref:recombinase RecT n=1 Tax=Streptomyces sp. G1 TaxID=361572 RepID=UPI002030BAEE|nr:recombinase RecT [Streptomyces sp. G1]MCM1977188.1 recombinase RecT [Streptomyces sp. G1]